MGKRNEIKNTIKELYDAGSIKESTQKELLLVVDELDEDNLTLLENEVFDIAVQEESENEELAEDIRTLVRLIYNVGSSENSIKQQVEQEANSFNILKLKQYDVFSRYGKKVSAKEWKKLSPDEQESLKQENTVYAAVVYVENNGSTYSFGNNKVNGTLYYTVDGSEVQYFNYDKSEAKNTYGLFKTLTMAIETVLGL